MLVVRGSDVCHGISSVSYSIMFVQSLLDITAHLSCLLRDKFIDFDRRFVVLFLLFVNVFESV